MHPLHYSGMEEIGQAEGSRILSPQRHKLMLYPVKLRAWYCFLLQMKHSSGRKRSRHPVNGALGGNRNLACALATRHSATELLVHWKVEHPDRIKLSTSSLPRTCSIN